VDTGLSRGEAALSGGESESFSVSALEAASPLAATLQETMENSLPQPSPTGDVSLQSEIAIIKDRASKIAFNALKEALRDPMRMNISRARL
jgi:hypothetical protein